MRECMEERWDELRTVVEILEGLGWRIDRFQVVDKDQEPIRAVIRVAYDPEDEEDVL